MDISWGELRSLVAALHAAPERLVELEAILGDERTEAQACAQALAYLYEHLAHQLGTRAWTKPPLDELTRSPRWHVALLVALGQTLTDPTRLDRLVWLLLLPERCPKALALCEHLLRDRAHERTPIDALLRFVIQGAPTLLARVQAAQHDCPPELLLQFLAAWTWCVLYSPRSSPILTLRKMPQDVWIIKSWPSSYEHGMDSSGWEIHCDASPAATITVLRCEIWPGLPAQLLQLAQTSPGDEAPQAPPPGLTPKPLT